MIKDKELANRLNAVKEGKEIPKPVIENNTLAGISVMDKNQEHLYETPEFPSMRSMFLASLLNFGEIAIMSLFYGFGLMTLLSKNWNILGILGVGLLINQVYSLISNLKLFK
jgi:hypothetical protein